MPCTPSIHPSLQASPPQSTSDSTQLVQGPFSKPLLWLRASTVSPADWWLQEAPKVKWLNSVGSRVLSLTHAAGGGEGTR